MVYLIEFADRIIVDMRRPGVDLDLPNMSIVPDTGVVCTLNWEHDGTFGLQSYTFFKSLNRKPLYDRKKAIHFLRQFRFKAVHTSDINPSDKHIIGYSDIGKGYKLIFTNHREPPYTGTETPESAYQMAFTNYAIEGQAQIDMDAIIRMPVFTNMFDEIYGEIKRKYPDFPKVLLGERPKLLTINTKYEKDNLLSIGRGGDAYIIECDFDNIETVLSPAELWGYLWFSFAHIMKDYFKDSNVAFNELGDLSGYMLKHDFKYEDIDDICIELEREGIYQFADAVTQKEKVPVRILPKK